MPQGERLGVVLHYVSQYPVMIVVRVIRMKLKIYLCALALVLGGCGGEDPDLSGPEKISEVGAGSNHGGGDQGGTSSFVGTWKYEFSGSGCVETLVFGGNGSFSVTSLDEQARGNYTTELVSGSTRRYVLSMSYTFDNSGADCTGISDDDAGTIVTKYYELGAGTLNFYSNSTSSNIIRTYRKS